MKHKPLSEATIRQIDQATRHRTRAYLRIAFASIFLLLSLALLTGEARAQSGGMLPVAFPQFFDSNGDPLAAGTLSFFVTGTSTPATVYSDAGLTTPTGVAGVITLDGAGRTPTAVYLGLQPYRVILKDSGGNTIATRDPVSAANYLALFFNQPTVQTITNTGTVANLALSSSTAPVVWLRVNNASDVILTGFVAPTFAQELVITSIGAGNVFLAPSTTSTAANQLVNAVTSGNTPLSAGVGQAAYVYDVTVNRWRLVRHEQGGWLAVTFNAANFTAGTMTWTLQAGDVTTLAYRLSGQTLLVSWSLVTTSTSGTASATLAISNAAYGGFTAATPAFAMHHYTDAGAARTTGIASVTASGTTLNINKVDFSTWSNAAANNTDTNGQISFPVQD